MKLAQQDRIAIVDAAIVLDRLVSAMALDPKFRDQVLIATKWQGTFSLFQAVAKALAVTKVRLS